MLGGTGHTGERLARRLVRRGHEVRILSRRGSADPVLAGLLRWGAIHVPGDATRRWTLWEAAEGCDAIVSCAHIRHAEAVVQAASRLGIQRFVQMSSTRRYTRFPCPTSREVITGERLIMASRLDYTIVRPTMIYGGRRDNNVTRLVDWFKRRRWFPQFGDGRNLLQPIFVEDLVDVLDRVVADPAATCRRDYTLAGPVAVPYRQFLREACEAVRREPPILLPVPLAIALVGAAVLGRLMPGRGLSAEQVRRLAEDKDVDITTAVRELGFAPRPWAVGIGEKVAGRAEIEYLYPG